jgi:hypothetical protein
MRFRDNCGIVPKLFPCGISIYRAFLYFSSRAVRTHWGHLVRTGVVKKEYKDISLNNVITLGTRIRIVVLRVSIVKMPCLLVI